MKHFLAGFPANIWVEGSRERGLSDLPIEVENGVVIG